MGLIHEVMTITYLKAVNKDKLLFASVICGISTGYSYLVWFMMHDSPLNILLYTLGCALGTYIGLVSHGLRQTDVD